MLKWKLLAGVDGCCQSPQLRSSGPSCFGLVDLAPKADAACALAVPALMASPIITMAASAGGTPTSQTRRGRSASWSKPAEAASD
jgi:hypothetical protein